MTLSEVERDALEYWELLDSEPNGWGQHVHPTFGQSHSMLRTMWSRHGELEFERALDETRVDHIRTVRRRVETAHSG